MTQLKFHVKVPESIYSQIAHGPNQKEREKNTQLNTLAAAIFTWKIKNFLAA